MNINTLTIKAQEALQTAMSTASAAGNQAVEPLHILSALTADDDSLAVFLLSRTGVGAAGVRTAVEAAIGALPRVSGSGGEQFFSTDSSRVIQRATDHTAQFGDRFASVEHLLLGLLGKEGGEAARILKSAGVNEKELIGAMK